MVFIAQYTRSLDFDGYLLTTMAQDAPYNPFSIILGRHPIYIGTKPFISLQFSTATRISSPSFVQVLQDK